MTEIKPLNEGALGTLMMVLPCVGIAVACVGLWWLAPAASLIVGGALVFLSGLASISTVKAASVAKLAEIEQAARRDAGVLPTVEQVADLTARLRKLRGAK